MFANGDGTTKHSRRNSPRYIKIPININGNLPAQFPVADDANSGAKDNRIYVSNEVDNVPIPLSDNCVLSCKANFYVDGWINLKTGKSQLNTWVLIYFDNLAGGFSGNFVLKGTGICLDNLISFWQGKLSLCGTGFFDGSSLKCTMRMNDGSYGIIGCFMIPAEAERTFYSGLTSQSTLQI